MLRLLCLPRVTATNRIQSRTFGPRSAAIDRIFHFSNVWRLAWPSLLGEPVNASRAPSTRAGLELLGSTADAASPVIQLRLSPSAETADQDEILLQVTDRPRRCISGSVSSIRLPAPMDARARAASYVCLFVCLSIPAIHPNRPRCAIQPNPQPRTLNPVIHRQAMADEALRRDGVLLTVLRLSPLDRGWGSMRPSLRLAVSAVHTERDLQKAAGALRSAARRVLQVSVDVCCTHGPASGSV
jgi:hypothetical protein